MSLLAIGYGDGKVLSLDTRLGEAQVIHPKTRAGISGLEWAPDNKGSSPLLATSDDSGTVRMWDMRNTGQPLNRWKCGSTAVRSLSWSKTEAGVLAVANGTRQVAIHKFDRPSGEAKRAEFRTDYDVHKLIWDRR